MGVFDPGTYWETRLRENWGLHGVGFAGLGRPYNKWMYRVRKHVFLREARLLNLHWPKVRVLDVGSGTGFYLSLWSSLGAKSIVGSDIAPVAVKRLKESCPSIPVVQIDIGRFLKDQQFAERDFDIVSAFDVLFHVIDDNAYCRSISNLSHLLRPNGFLLFSENCVHTRTLRSQHHVSRSIEEVKNTLEAHGFTIVRRAPMFVLMNAPVDTKGSLPLILWKVLMAPVTAVNWLGFFYGLALFPIELGLVRFLRESPSTEILICQKVV